MKTGVLALVLVALFASSASAIDFHVNSFNDRADANPGDRQCATAAPVECTLRAAIQEANALSSSASIQIFLQAGTYLLSRAAPVLDEERQQIFGVWDAHAAGVIGDLDIRRGALIRGQGPGVTIVDAGGIDRVFDIWQAAGAFDLRIEQMTVRGGSTTYPGGCINNRYARNGVWLFEVHIEDCEARNWIGGGMFNNGDVIMRRTVWRNNRAGRGGALENADTAHIDESTFVGNSTQPFGTEISTGGAISNVSGRGLTPDLWVRNSTFSDNQAWTGGGGAIMNRGSARISNSTISGNTASFGGGVLTEFPPAPTGRESTALSYTTIVHNRGGGLRRTGDVPVGIGNSIVAFNTPVFGSAPANCMGGVTTSNTSIENDITCGFAGSGDMVMTNPMIGPLADNGGPTLTHALLAGSPAIDAGSPTPEHRDQRNYPRPVFGGPDIGAFEKGFDITLLIPLDWSSIFGGIFTMSDTSFRLNLSLKTLGKTPEIAEARVVGVKGANATVKIAPAKDGQSYEVSGVFTPPKDLSSETLFYLEIVPAVEKASHVRISDVACNCDATPRKNPPPIIIPPGDKIAREQ
ncbi:MAG TPA: CSLREA domain-containing protein [Vicinamibacterales bacterium]|nr:CSLREA domain-containing protein [Vicinamibacterales bacterium]